MKRFLLPVCLLLMLTACDEPDQDIIETSLVWSRTQPLPAAAEQVETVALGNMFTRELEVSFHASKESIESWLKDSPGIQDAAASEVGNISTYAVTPGGGAQFSQVTVDWGVNRYHPYLLELMPLFIAILALMQNKRLGYTRTLFSKWDNKRNREARQLIVPKTKDFDAHNRTRKELDTAC